MAGTSMCGWSAGWLARILVMVWTAGRFWTRPLRRGVQVCKKYMYFIFILYTERKKKSFTLPELRKHFITLWPSSPLQGVFCCGPAPVKAVRERRTDLIYDIPFVYAEVNADVIKIIVRDGRVLSRSKDTERVGSLICTKAVGFPRYLNITRDYKHITSMSWKIRLFGSMRCTEKDTDSVFSSDFYNTGPTSSIRSRNSALSDESTLRTGNFWIHKYVDVIGHG